MNKRDEIWKVKFIEELQARGVVADACIAAGISMSAAYMARKKALMSCGLGVSEANDFASKWDDAIREAVERSRAEQSQSSTNGEVGKIPDILPMSRRRKQKPRMPNGSWHDKFIKELRRRGVVQDACRAACIDVSAAYTARKKALQMRAAGASGENDFAARWDEALEEAVESLEGETWRRGVDGIKKPVYYRGRKVGEIRRYSDGLLSLLLKAHRPMKYRDKAWSSGELPPETRAVLEKYYASVGTRKAEELWNTKSAKDWSTKTAK